MMVLIMGIEPIPPHYTRITVLIRTFFALSQSFAGRYGIRTHEANADDLKSSPFDRSGNLPILSDLSDRSHMISLDHNHNMISCI